MIDSHQLALLRQEICCAIEDGIEAALPSPAERRTAVILQAVATIMAGGEYPEKDAINLVMEWYEQIYHRVEAAGARAKSDPKV
jgi:hypothetical protein